MPRGRSTSSAETNGHNGRYVEGSGTDIRKAITIQGIFGSTSDARVLYHAVPGSTGDGWVELERILTPVRSYVLEGEAPYVRPVALSIEQSNYQGVPCPAGDCAEDALPPELRNQNREAEKRKMEETSRELATNPAS